LHLLVRIGAVCQGISTLSEARTGSIPTKLNDSLDLTPSHPNDDDDDEEESEILTEISCRFLNPSLVRAKKLSKPFSFLFINLNFF